MPYYRGEQVSDAYLQGMLLAYRQAYINAGGPDYEDSDQNLLDKFSSRGIVDNSGAAGLGREDAAADKAAGQEAHAQSLSAGGAVNLATAPKNVPPIINTMTTGGDARAFLTLDGLPTMGGSAAPNQSAAALIAAGGSPITSGGSSLFGGSGGGTPWLLIVGIGIAAWYLLKGKS